LTEHGALFQAHLRTRTAVLATALALLVAVMVQGWTGLVAAILGLLAALLVGALIARRLGGITGDVLGAGVEITELGVLLAGAAWAHRQP
jgi:adenosylcobinamide-GDP ribazoletransferase